MKLEVLNQQITEIEHHGRPTTRPVFNSEDHLETSVRKVTNELNITHVQIWKILHKYHIKRVQCLFPQQIFVYEFLPMVSADTC